MQHVGTSDQSDDPPTIQVIDESPNSEQRPHDVTSLLWERLIPVTRHITQRLAGDDGSFSALSRRARLWWRQRLQFRADALDQSIKLVFWKIPLGEGGDQALLFRLELLATPINTI